MQGAFCAYRYKIERQIEIRKGLPSSCTKMLQKAGGFPGEPLHLPAHSPALRDEGRAGPFQH